MFSFTFSSNCFSLSYILCNYDIYIMLYLIHCFLDKIATWSLIGLLILIIVLISLLCLHIVYIKDVKVEMVTKVLMMVNVVVGEGNTICLRCVYIKLYYIICVWMCCCNC